MKSRRLLIRTIILLLLGAAVIYTLYANWTKEEAATVSVGKKAPDFVLVDMGGNQHRLSDYQGQGVLLNFWGTWCKPCEKEMPYLDSGFQKFKEQGVQVLAVNVGESELAVQQFIDQYKLSFPVVIDSDNQVQTAYGINPLPITFLIDKNGVMVKSYTGELTEKMVQDFMEQIKP
ncbi:thiol-disulfide oxidoreductase ResA [Bacillus sp. 03113]|uniref:thiol-disulfide oxidoreductase ResA n=1 Tax=Bacillus sp. 03113 TaxID=2578211 RepID=UPI001143C041|nr:thiol-disulfide oxidoreductase ResA [Bacillus sp. 03113]